MTLHCNALLGNALLHFVVRCVVVCCVALLCFPLRYLALHCTALLRVASHCVTYVRTYIRTCVRTNERTYVRTYVRTLHYLSLLCIAWLCFPLHCFALLCTSRCMRHPPHLQPTHTSRYVRTYVHMSRPAGILYMPVCEPSRRCYCVCSLLVWVIDAVEFVVACAKIIAPQLKY